MFKTLPSNSVSAVNHINSLEPPVVYDRLRSNLPDQETPDYLVKVVGFRKQFVSLPASNERLAPWYNRWVPAISVQVETLRL